MSGTVGFPRPGLEGGAAGGRWRPWGRFQGTNRLL